MGSPNSTEKRGLKQRALHSKDTRLVFIAFHRHIYAISIDNSVTKN